MRGKADFHNEAHNRQSDLNSGKLGRLTQSHQPPICPECGSNKIWKDGLRYNAAREIQRYLCRTCGYRFSEPNVKVNVTSQILETLKPRENNAEVRVLARDNTVKEASDDLSLSLREDVGPHNLSIVEKSLNTLPFYNRKRRVCVSEDGAKNLAEQVALVEKWAAGATAQKLVDFSMWMLKEGYSENTITLRVKLLKILMRRGADLYEPETVKETIAKQPWCNGRKVNAVNAYSTFLRMTGGHWDPPHYEQPQKIVFIPTEQEIDQLIAGCGRKTATVLQTLKETAARIGEVAKMKWADVDTEQQIIRVNAPEKGSLPRAPKIFDHS